MPYYYKLNKELSKQLIEIMNKIDDYESVVVDWLRLKFNFSTDMTYEIFNDVPIFTQAIVNENELLKDLVVKRTLKLNQKDRQACKLIYSWKAFKLERGYAYHEMPMPFLTQVRYTVDRELSRILDMSQLRVKSNRIYLETPTLSQVPSQTSSTLPPQTIEVSERTYNQGEEWRLVEEWHINGGIP